jgi:hypothetical protein
VLTIAEVMRKLPNVVLLKKISKINIKKACVNQKSVLQIKKEDYNINAQIKK